MWIPDAIENIIPLIMHNRLNRNELESMSNYVDRIISDRSEKHSCRSPEISV